MPTRPFSGLTDGSIVPPGQLRFPVTLGKRDNYHTELIDFDVAHIDIPYNAILGHPSLAKFMAATRHGHNVLKMPGCSGIITVAYDEKDVAALSSMPTMPRRPITLMTKVAFCLSRPPPRRRSSSSQSAIRRPRDQLATPQSLRPQPRRLSLPHKKARLVPPLGRARGLPSGEPMT
nr:uncharacterized protein LOC109756792 [Aegilops tauschii subsp. strangulata]